MGLVSDHVGGVAQPRSKEFLAFVAEEEARLQAPIKARIAEQSLLLQQITEQERLIRLQSLYKEPSPELSNCKAYVPDDMTPAQVQAAVGRAVDQLKAELAAQGITLHQAGVRRLCRVMLVNLHIDTRDANNLRACYDLLDSLGEFRPDEVTKPALPEPVAEPIVEPETTLEDLSLEDRDGNRLAKKLVIEGIIKEQRPLFLEFVQFVRDTYNHPVTQSDQDKVVDYCVQHGGFTVKNLNLARVRILRCLTPDEQLAESLEAENQPADRFDVRTSFIKRQRELREAARQ